MGSRYIRQRCSGREQQPSPVTAPEDRGILRLRLSLWSITKHSVRICGSLIDALALIRVECFPSRRWRQMRRMNPLQGWSAPDGDRRRPLHGARSVDTRSVQRPHSRKAPHNSRRRAHTAAYCASVWFWPSSPTCPECSLPKFDV
jgi:hypothetical protein